MTHELKSRLRRIERVHRHRAGLCGCARAWSWREATASGEGGGLMFVRVVLLGRAGGAKPVHARPCPVCGVVPPTPAAAEVDSQAVLDKAMAMVEALEAELGIEADHTTSLMARCRRALTFDARMTAAEALEWWGAATL